MVILRKILIVLLFSLSLSASATNYYVKNGGNDALSGTSDANAWETVTKVNTMWAAGIFAPGDSILFNRGNIFLGYTLNVTESGSVGNPIVVGAYGTGDDPIFSGFTTLSTWTDEGDGIYSKSVTVESRPTVLTFDGVNTAKGRYPNSTWLTVDSYVDNTSITDAALPASPDYDDGQIVIQKSSYVLDVALITDHSDHTITYTSSETSNAAVGDRYFIQDHVATLDAYKEWAYSPSTGKVYVYFGTNNPIDHVVKIATIDRFADIKGRSYITFDGLHFTGYNDVVFYIGTSTNNYITFNDCTFDYIGNCGIFGDANAINNYTTITNNVFDNINGQGLYFWKYAHYLNISNNTFTNIAYIRGLGGNLSYASAIRRPTGNGIFARGDYLTISNNVIENIGYCGIWFLGTNALVQYNFIKKTNQIMTDGAGIYTWSGNYYATGQEIKNNIVINSPDGYGIYVDDKSRSVVINSNIVSNQSLGIYLHNAHEIDIDSNVVHNCGIANYFVHDSYAPVDSISNIEMKHNTFIAKASSQYSFAMWSSLNDNLTFGVADSNYYARPIDDDNVIRTRQPSTGTKYRTLSGWQTFSSQDAHSSGSPISVNDTADIDFYYNATSSPNTETLPYPSIDLAGTKYATEYEVPAWSGVVLLKDPDPDSDPPDAPTVTTSTLTWNGVLIASGGGTVSDDGTISARGICWSSTGIPTTADDKTTDGTGAGTFTSAMTGLAEDTIYYVRAYATNEIATSYGTVETYSTFARPVTSGGKPMVSNGKILTIH